MEYRRRRRRRRRSAGTGSGAGKVVVVLLLAAGVIYLVSASKVGTWLAQQVIAPVFATIETALMGRDSAQPSGDQSGGGLVLNTDGVGKQETAQLQLPGLDAYLLQMGVYSQQDNAQTQAQLIQARGAAGYVLNSGDGRYRVMAAAYADAASLSSVREQLKDEGIETASHQLTMAGAVFDVKGTAEQIEVMEQAFLGFDAAISELGALAIRFDKEGMSAQDARGDLQALHTSLNNILGQVGNIPETGILPAVKACYQAGADSLNRLLEGDAASYSSLLKRAHLELIWAYYQLLGSAV